MLWQHFVDVDCRITPLDEGTCRLSYRHGFRTWTPLGWAGRHITLQSREIPETVAVLDRWVTRSRDELT